MDRLKKKMILRLKIDDFVKNEQYKVECVFPMVILSEFLTEQYKNDDHREDASHFITIKIGSFRPK